MPLLTLIRHAQSIANAGAATSLPEAIPLSEEGHRQARELVEKIAPPPSLIVHSSYLRTKQTADPLIAKFPHVPVEVWALHEFTYIAPERVQNTTFTGRRPIVEAYWQRNDPFYIDGAGAESFAQFVERIDRCIDQARKSHHKHIIVFTHALVMKLIELRTYTTNISLQEVMSKALQMQRDAPVKNSQLISYHL